MAGYASATAMTIESCITFCETKGFAYAGVEYPIKCFCGNTLLLLLFRSSPLLTACHALVTSRNLAVAPVE